MLDKFILLIIGFGLTIIGSLIDCYMTCCNYNFEKNGHCFGCCYKLSILLGYRELYRKNDANVISFEKEKEDKWFRCIY